MLNFSLNEVRPAVPILYTGRGNYCYVNGVQSTCLWFSVWGNIHLSPLTRGEVNLNGDSTKYDFIEDIAAKYIGCSVLTILTKKEVN